MYNICTYYTYLLYLLHNTIIYSILFVLYVIISLYNIHIYYILCYQMTNCNQYNSSFRIFDNKFLLQKNINHDFDYH